jgi:FixJ family two-component response regulator
MPGLSGVELQSLLIAQGHRTPMIFVTACPEDNTRERALKAGAIGFLNQAVQRGKLDQIYPCGPRRS